MRIGLPYWILILALASIVAFSTFFMSNFGDPDPKSLPGPKNALTLVNNSSSRVEFLLNGVDPVVVPAGETRETGKDYEIYQGDSIQVRVNGSATLGIVKAAASKGGCCLLKYAE